MSTRLALRIQDCYERLTSSERRLAEAVLARPGILASHSATELAGLAGVSKSTAARFFRSLGYADFAEVRLLAREERDRTAPVSLTDAVADAPAPRAGTVAAHLQAEAGALVATLESISSDQLAEAAALVAGAPRAWCVAQGREAAFAQLARALLAALRPDVWRFEGAGAEAAVETALVGPRDALIVIAGAEGMRRLEPLVAYAKTARARILLVSDPATAAIWRRRVDATLECRGARRGEGLPLTPLASVLQLLAARVEARLGEKARQRRALVEAVAEEIGR